MRIESPGYVPEIDIALGSLFDKSTLYSIFSPAHAHVDLIKEAGYRGIEWMPIRCLGEAQLRVGQVSASTREAITSLHQSYRSEKSLIEAITSDNRMVAVASYLFLPEREASLNDLEAIQRVVGRQLPVVLYADNDHEESGVQRSFGDKTFQPTPEIMYKWSVKNAHELIVEARKRGYTGFCVDLAHMRREPIGELSLSPWQETLPQLLSFAQEIHVSAGRADMPYAETQGELVDLLYGTNYTELPAMLEVVRGTGWKGRVVTEIPAIGLHKLHNNSSFLPVKTLIKDHKEIVQNIQKLLS